MKKTLYLLCATLMIYCSNTNSQIIQNVGASQFYELIKKEEGIIIDVRTPEEFHSSHIEDASNVNFYADNFSKKLNIIRKDLPIYIYCRSGGRSSKSANKMEKLGFTKVYNLVGGISAWNSENYATIKSKKNQKSSQVTFTISELENVLKKHNVVLIDFSAEWCVPCQKMKPVIKEIQKEKPNTKVLFIDADVNKELIKKYQVKEVPVFIIFKNSNEIFRHVGVISKEKLLKQLE